MFYVKQHRTAKEEKRDTSAMLQTLGIPKREHKCSITATTISTSKPYSTASGTFYLAPLIELETQVECVQGLSRRSTQELYTQH